MFNNFVDVNIFAFDTFVFNIFVREFIFLSFFGFDIFTLSPIGEIQFEGFHASMG